MIKEAKQVIVMRKDLNMRKGKMIAQGSHASLGAILKMMTSYDPYTDPLQYDFIKKFSPVKWREKRLKIEEGSALHAWIYGRFTKVTVSVDSEEELMDIYNKAADLPKILITDAGLTEFAGVKTKTCIAIGPGFTEDIDKVTKHLKLL